VQVMTAHKSKGLEFRAVFVPHAADSVWGGGTKRNYFDIPFAERLKKMEFDPIDDERRLLYVAMTRAKERLYLSNAEVNTDGRELIASRLFDDIDEKTLVTFPTEAVEAAFSPIAMLLKKVEPQQIDARLFETHLKNRGLSATGLNNYLKSPWDYLYRTVLRIPQVQPLPMLFGIAMHGVMEWVSAVYASCGNMPTPTQIKDALTRELSRLPITDTEFARLHEKGFEALLAYTDFIKTSMPKESKVEFSVSVIFKTGIPEFPEVTLTGKLDRIDIDENGNVVRVVDYKTGKPKTRNDIEGKTQSSNGDYKRQLTFYALMLSLYEDERYRCKTGTLSFVEPDSKGMIHEEVFMISDDEIEELKKDIIRVVGEIISGSFLNTPCDEKVSDYCHLASLIVKM